MATLLLIGVGVVLLLGLALIVIGLRVPAGEDTLEARLAELGAGGQMPTLEEIELSLPFSERVVMPVLRQLAEFVTRMTPAQTIERTRHKLELAGFPYRIGPAEFLAARYVLGALFGGAILVALGPANLPVRQKMLLIPVVALLGFFLPVMWLGSQIRRRQTEIIRALPDALDLLTICVEAGLGFDAAMAKVAEKWDNELSRAFTRVLQEIQLGKLRREALRDMADSMDVQEVSTFCAAVIQAEQLGVSISKVLRIQADEMRVRRRQRAEELARQAPIKIMIPTAFLIFPALFIVLLGPAALTLMSAGGLFGGAVP
ncbi:MAG TPA: type II secretion system F family protein [Anaerolineales bacterium]|nr:type II secretion system F family protein [Anaerolineae bacterium]HIQ01484.1 type II secretion system F family protein [Anaerolineales bacterium]